MPTVAAYVTDTENKKLEAWSELTGLTKSTLIWWLLKQATIEDLNHQWLSEDVKQQLLHQ